MDRPHRAGTLRRAVGAAAVVAPAPRTATDLLEWHGGGFSALQLALNYLAFLPMPWLLLGLHAVHDDEPPAFGLVGALLHGAAFTYFAHTTLYAWTERIGNYDALWQRLGDAYTAHGALMVIGGGLFAAAVWRARWLPRWAVALFAAGLVINLLLALLLPLPILQTIGTATRNLGLMALGWSILAGGARRTG